MAWGRRRWPITVRRRSSASVPSWSGHQGIEERDIVGGVNRWVSWPEQGYTAGWKNKPETCPARLYSIFASITNSLNSHLTITTTRSPGSSTRVPVRR
jgi:hypothetical protein